MYFYLLNISLIETRELRNALAKMFSPYEENVLKYKYMSPAEWIRQANWI